MTETRISNSPPPPPHTHTHYTTTTTTTTTTHHHHHRRRRRRRRHHHHPPFITLPGGGTVHTEHVVIAAGPNEFPNGVDDSTLEGSTVALHTYVGIFVTARQPMQLWPHCRRGLSHCNCWPAAGHAASRYRVLRSYTRTHIHAQHHRNIVLRSYMRTHIHAQHHRTRYIGVTEPLTASQRDVVKGGCMVFDDRTCLNYFRPVDGGAR
jgi:hypothetical protein